LEQEEQNIKNTTKMGAREDEYDYLFKGKL